MNFMKFNHLLIVKLLGTKTAFLEDPQLTRQVHLKQLIDNLVYYLFLVLSFVIVGLQLKILGRFKFGNVSLCNFVTECFGFPLNIGKVVA